MPEDEKVLAETKYLKFVRRGDWDYVTRPNISGVVCIVAATPEDKLLLVEQYRAPLGRRAIEFPAGLSGDQAGEEREPLAAAAQRELLEETGYAAKRLTQVFEGPSSSGLTDETIAFFVAEGLTRVHDGGGDASEAITVHEAPRGAIDAWLAQKAAEGYAIDIRIPAGLYLLEKHRR
jgi:ADP-ribose pyrophosphatase